MARSSDGEGWGLPPLGDTPEPVSGKSNIEAPSGTVEGKGNTREQIIQPASVPSSEEFGNPTVQQSPPPQEARVGDMQGHAFARTSASGTLTDGTRRARSHTINDQPNASDHIGFEPYVNALAQFLMNENTRPPLTVSLEGEWGSGKSSFMKQLEAAIKKRFPTDSEHRPSNKPSKKQPLILHFNAWRHDKEDALWASFALEFIKTVRSEFKIWQRPRLALHFAWKRRKPVAAAIVLPLLRLIVITLLVTLLLAALANFLLFPKVEGAPFILDDWFGYFKRWWPAAVAVPGVQVLLDALKHITTKPLELDLNRYVSAPAYKEKVSFLEQFHEDFERFVDVYLGGRKTLVFVDDLDRCEVPKAAELLRAINLMLPEKASITLVLALDRQKIAMGIAVRNKELLPFLPFAGCPSDDDEQSDENKQGGAGIAYGYEFVEKFIQVPFRIPKLVDVRLPKFVDSLLAPNFSSDKQAQSQGSIDKDIIDEDIIDEDPEGTREVLKMVAAALDYNPRRLKQFLNLFRLRFFIAMKTGQMHGEELGWTLPQLGKMVAIELRWPLLLNKLLQQPGSFKALLAESSKDDKALKALVEYKRDPASSKDYDFSEGVIPHVRTLYGTTHDDEPAEGEKESGAG